MDIGKVKAKSKICKDCRQAFTLTEGELKFYAERNMHEPERCKKCRRRRREEKRNG
jgi:hypothetical protein